MRYLVYLIALLTVCWGCKEDPSATPPPSPTLTVSTQAVTFEASQTDPASVAVTTNQSQWTATCPPTDTWCHLQPQGQMLLIKVDPNKTTTTRSTLVTVTVGTGAQRLERTVAVTQNASDQPTEPEPEDPENPEEPDTEIALNLSSESLTLPIAGGSEFITVTLSASWSATLPAVDNWCSLTMSPPVGFTLTAPENTTGTDRSTTITVTATDGTTTTAKTVVVTQLKNGEITAAFTDLYFKAFVLRHYDKNLDNKIQLSEVETATSMIVGLDADYGADRRNIKSLAGIEYFTGLLSFMCTSDVLTQVDLSGNTKLWTIYISAPALTGLDVSHQPQLSGLSCSGCALTSLDISHNPELSSLSCDRNQLTTLDISFNPKLTSLNCNDNKLTQIKTTQNTTLTQLICRSNSFSTLDLSDLKALKQLDCSSNQLTALDVSLNVKLEQLICSSNNLAALDVTRNILLQTLYCNNNQLSPALDISRNTTLGTLWCQDNPSLTTIWVKPGFVAPVTFSKDPTANYVVKN